MKIVKILFILLVPALGFVGCRKADMRPGSCQDHAKNSNTNSNNAPSDARTASTENNSVPTDANNIPSNARVINTTDASFSGDEGNNPSDIIGSGDDDRDGGDKKKKSTAK